MVRGLKLKELRARLELGHNLDEYVLLEVEGEMLAYHKVYDNEMIKCYKNLGVDLGLLLQDTENKSVYTILLKDLKR